MTFELFDKMHIIYLIGYASLFIFLYFLVSLNSNPKKMMKRIALFVILIKIGEIFIRYQLIGEAWNTLLPLHLCNISLIFALLSSLVRFNPFRKATFFWSIGAFLALLVPEVRDLFPRFFNISFFITHVYIIFVAVVEYRLFDLRITFPAWTGSFIGLNIYASAVYFINDILDTNYLYINKQPSFSSIFSTLGGWPYYIIAGEIIYVILTLIIFFLFKTSRHKVKIKY